MTRPSSRRGAARVSAVWLIFAGVLALAGLAFAFIAQSDLATEQERASKAVAQEQAARTEAQTRTEERRNVSSLLGWFNRESADPASDVEAVKGAMDSLRTAFPDISATDGDFETMLPKVRAAFDKRGEQIANLQNQIKQLEGQLDAARQSTTQVTTDKDGVIGELRSQYADLEQRLTDRESDLEQRLAASQDELSERDASLRETVAQAEEEARSFVRKERTYGARINALADATKLTREPFSELPDGQVTEVSDSTSYAYIDLGADQRVNRGLRFRIVSSTSGGSRTKGWCEVSEVFPTYAEVQVYELTDRYDPVVPGDKIVNPLFDPETQRRAVLMGRFSGAYGEGEVISLLQRMGIYVQDDLDVRTNYVILGSELYNDPETGEPIDEPMSPTELTDFKRSQNLGVVPITIEQLREYSRVYG